MISPFLALIKILLEKTYSRLTVRITLRTSAEGLTPMTPDHVSRRAINLQTAPLPEIARSFDPQSL